MVRAKMDWYEMTRKGETTKGFNKIAKKYDVNRLTVRNWYYSFDWEEWGRQRDIEVANELKKREIAKTADILEAVDKQGSEGALVAQAAWREKLDKEALKRGEIIFTEGVSIKDATRLFGTCASVRLRIHALKQGVDDNGRDSSPTFIGSTIINFASTKDLEGDRLIEAITGNLARLERFGSILRRRIGPGDGEDGED